MSEKLRRWLARLRLSRIRDRLFAAMIFLSLPPLFFLGFLCFNIARDTLTEYILESNGDHLQTTSEVADLLFQNIINLNRFIVLNEDILNDLRNTKIRSRRELREMNELTINRLQRVVNNNSFDTRFVSSLCIFDLYNQAYCMGRPDYGVIYEAPDKKRMIEQSDWYRQAVEAQGRVVFFSYNVLDETATSSFSTIKLLRDPASIEGEPLGLLVTNLSVAMFRNISRATRDYGQFLVVDATGGAARVMFPESWDRAPEQPAVYGDLIAQWKDEGSLVSEYRNATTGWHFIHLFDKKEILAQSNRIGIYTGYIAALIAVVALTVSYFVSVGITRPLLQLKKMMIDWNKGTLDLSVRFKDDEVGTIGKTILRVAQMNAELDARVIQAELREREAELRALQAQINPHFLYNTLDSIYWMARLGKTKEAATMALALSDSFKLSLNKGNELIPVFKELLHVEHYLTIQNIRYKGRIRYEIDVEQDVLGCEMLKLILQPLVENAVYHGLEPKTGNGLIRITGRKIGDELKFVVEDDGVGMGDPPRTEQGYGLRNVRERLKLYYGPFHSFRIWSSPGSGTKIEIRINPKKGGMTHVESGSVR